MTGKEKELQDYRERAVILAQKNKDENSGADFLSRRDKLTRDDMPEEMKQGIVDFILSVGDNIVENIYLVRKTVSESFFTSVFIIHFYGGTDKQRDEIMHKIFRYLDSYPVDCNFRCLITSTIPKSRWIRSTAHSFIPRKIKINDIRSTKWKP
jgi:hypothetical protein